MTTIVLSRASLLPALAEADRAVQKRNTIPVLANLRLEVGLGELEITGTDLDVEISATVPAAGGGKAFTLPSGTFHDAVRKMPDGVEISIAVDDQTAIVSGGRSKFRMPILPAEDFPSMAAGVMENAFTLEPTDLARILSTVAFAISSEEARYYLNGVYLHETEGRLAAVATDGHRLARLTLPLPEGAAGMPGIILPRRTVDLLKAFANGKAPIAVALSSSKIRFEARREGAPTMIMTSKLIDGTFPDYQRVIPAGNQHRYTVNREALTKAVDRVVTIAASARTSAVKFAFGDDNTLRLATINPDAGSAEDEVDLSASAETTIEIGFNGRYCLDMLAATAAETITFALGDAGSPGLVTPAGGDDAVTFVIMPMRV